jgi:hypothetical protein
MAADDLGLEQPDDGLGEGIVVAVTDAPDGGLDPRLEEALRVPNADVLPGLNWSSQHHPELTAARDCVYADPASG